MTADPFARAAASAATLKRLAGADGFDAVVVLGSGWLAAADAIGAPEAEIPIADLGGFKQPTRKGSRTVRSIYKKGPAPRPAVPRTNSSLRGAPPARRRARGAHRDRRGCRTVVLTNAAGGINAGYAVGQPVLISDHINLTGRSPLGAAAGERALPVHRPHPGLLGPAARAARQLDPSLAEGVYAAVPGPHFETPAEIRMLRAAGADLVGMSTVLEAIAARHLGAEVLGISMVSNPAAGLSDEPIDHQDVLAAGEASAARVGALLSELLPRV